MGNVAANAYKGKLQYYWEQAAGGAPDIQVALMQAAGNPADGAVVDYTTLTALWAGTADEATFTNYARKTLTNPAVTIDNTADQVSASSDVTITWTNAGGAANNTLARAVFFYDPAPGSSTDTTRLPLFYCDIAATTDGTTLVLTVNASGLFVYKATV